MKRGLRRFLSLLFILGTMALVMWIAFSNNDLGSAWELLFTLNPLYLLLAWGCWFAYTFFDALGYHYFLRKQGYPVRMGYAVFLSLMGFYYSNITPGASGGQPMQIYYMSKRDIPIGIGTSAISMKFLSNQLVTVVLASVLWALNLGFVNAQLSGVRWLYLIGWAINAAAVPLILMVTFCRRTVQRMLGGLVRLGTRMRIIKRPDVAALRMNNMLDTYHASFMRLGRHPKQIFIQLMLSVLSVSGLMAIVLCVYAALGQSGVAWYELMTVAYLLFLSASYTPLPGASGAQEGGFLVFYHGLFAEGVLGMALLVWRFMSYYMFLIVGAALSIIMQLRLSRASRTVDASGERP